MSTQPDIAAARADVQRSRSQIADTISEIESRVTAPVRAVTHRLDVGRLIQEHPWAALTTAVAVGAAVSASRADARAAALAAEGARKGAEKARAGGAAGVQLAREAPSRSRQALGSFVDMLGAKVAVTIIDALRAQRPAPTAEARQGLGFVHHDAPAHEVDTEAASPT